MRIPLASDIESRDGTLAAGALLVNAAVQIESESETTAFKRSGVVSRGAVTSGMHSASQVSLGRPLQSLAITPSR